MTHTKGMIAALAATAFAAGALPPSPGSSEIKVGMSGALSGPAKDLGQGMKTGIEAWFARVNSTGGVDGRTLRLVAIDDGYEPDRAARNVRGLIKDEKVFAILGNPGTPTAAVTVPIVNDLHVPFVGAFTGAGLLRKTPPDRYVINYRASYVQETAEMVRGLLHEVGLRPSEIAFFTQNDAYGDAGYNGGIAALKANGYAEAERLVHGRYTCNPLDLEGALAQMLDPTVHPRAVIMVGAYKPCAQFIRLARRHGLDAIFINVSFVIGDSLREDLGADAEGVVVTQVVPPIDSELPAVRDFRESVPAPLRGFVALEGFLAARAFVEGLRRAGAGATGDAFIDALESAGPIDLGLGEPLAITKGRHQLSNRVWPTIIRGGKFRSLRSWKEAALRGGANG